MSWRILVVDDETNLAEVIQAGLDSLPNCQASLATNGQDALRLFEDETFDLLITDFRMPGMDGLALARHIHAQSPHTAIILLTACVAELPHDLVAHQTVTHILEKPVTLPTLRTAALDILERLPGHENADTVFHSQSAQPADPA
jgi:CheY-like chemotaxis protein